MTSTFKIPGPEGQLEAIYHEALGLAADAAPRALAIVCHPHPIQGGNMHSTVAFKIARALSQEGVACLRFNFRGVGESSGRFDGEGGEERDARAALDWLALHRPAVPLWAAGFSFGSRTVLGLAQGDPTIERLILVGLPVKVYPPEGLDQLTTPGLLIWGDRDEFGVGGDLVELHPHLPESLELQEIEGADHLFRRYTRDLEERVGEYAQRMLNS